jgi:hypothetical protein
MIQQSNDQAAVTYSFNRLHIPSGRHHVGTFDASHHDCFGSPNCYPLREIRQTIMEKLNEWNRSQAGEWQYWVTP